MFRNIYLKIKVLVRTFHGYEDMSFAFIEASLENIEQLEGVVQKAVFLLSFAQHILEN